MWFVESYLQPIIIEFWQESTSQGFQFLQNYINEITEELVKYPETLNNLKDFIHQQLDKHNEHLKEIAKQNELENRLREEELKRREELKLKEEELRLKQEEERIKMKKKLEDYVKNISEPSIKQSQNLDENSVQLPMDNKDLSASEAKNIEIENSSAFTTFTNLGLKRKKLDDKNGER